MPPSVNLDLLHSTSYYVCREKLLAYYPGILHRTLYYLISEGPLHS